MTVPPSAHHDGAFRELFELAPDGIFMADLDGRYTEVNAAGCRLLGYRRDELVGKTIVDLILPEEVGRLDEAKRDLLTGGFQVAEWHLRRKDGSVVPVEVSAKILDGAWLGFVRDISARKAAEAALADGREVEQRLRRNLEDLMAASFTISEATTRLPESGIEIVLQTIALQAKALVGAEYAAVGIGSDPGAPFDPWVVVGIGEELRAAIGRPPRPIGTLGIPACEGGVVRVADAREHGRFGGFPLGHPEMTSLLGVPVMFRGHPVGNIYLGNKQGAAEFSEADERAIRMLAARTGAAIETARLYQTEALQRLWLESIFDQMPDCVLIFDEQGRVTHQNLAAAALAHPNGRLDPWGRPLTHDFRTATGAVIPVDELPIYRALRLGETVTSADLAILAPDGRLVPCSASAAPLLTARGPAGAVAVFHDVHILKQLERLREEWISVVAHDLRQPVNTIVITADTALRRRDELDERARRGFDRIGVASHRLSRMIDDLLDASRIEARRLSIDRRLTDLSAIIDQVVGELREALAPFTVVVAAPLEEPARVDGGRIHQVLANLVSNASKYGAPGTEIRIEAVDHADHVAIAVTNHGPGISADQLAVLFNRFVRTREARTGETPGLGLGLYIAKGLVEAHGGRLWAESVPGAATTFRFTLPRAS